MRSALVADLHANREALESVLEHGQRQGVARWVFLGDFVGYGADPAWVVDTVRALVRSGATAVQGNHDLAVAHGATPTMGPDVRQAIDWTRSQLAAEQIDFLSGLPIAEQQDDRLFVHANAYDPAGWGYIAGCDEAQRSLRATRCRYTFCGHMHGPRLFHRGVTGRIGEFVPAAGVSIPMSAHRQWLAIPGSAGQPRDGNPAACYAVFDDADCALTFHRVPYDHDRAAAKIIAAALPPHFASRLGDGQ